MIDEELKERGVKVNPTNATGDVWKLVDAKWLDENESQGKHHIYVELLDENGQRVTGQKLKVRWPTGESTITSEAKPGEPFAANFPLSPSRNEFSIKIDGANSDEVTGIGMGANTPSGFNPGIHTSTALTFQKQKNNQGEQPIEEPIENPIEEPVEPPIEEPIGDNFDRAYEFVSKWEGGFQNHPDDHGNWTGGRKGVGELKGTNFGISAASYPYLDIQNLTREQAKEIFRKDYWEASGANELSWPLNLIVFDTAVLHGVNAAKRWLEQYGNNPFAYVANRLRVYANSENWQIFGRGWTNRIIDLLDYLNKPTN